MKLVIISIILLLITTLKPSYLGKFSCISLVNVTTSANTKIIQCVLVLLLALSTSYFIFKSQIDSLWVKKIEGLENIGTITGPAGETYQDETENKGTFSSPAGETSQDETENKGTLSSPVGETNNVTPENILQKLNTIMREGDGFSIDLEYDQSIDIYKEGIEIYKQMVKKNDKLDDTLISNLQNLVIEFNQKIATEYRDKASSLKCDKTNDPTSENCKNADEALKLAKEYRSKTIADMCSEVPNSGSGLCKNTSSTSGTYTDTIQPDSLIKGLDVNNVTPSPIYYEPGTVKYGGLGYNPSYTDINYMNNKFTTKPEIVNQFNKKGFCDLSNNMMENINEKCENLPKGVCATTSCCVLVGDEKCVQGNEQGPTNALVYSDTTIKNRDVYYFQGKCYGNCT